MAPAPQLKTIVLAIPPERIALFKAIVESYDNLATLRTEDPAQHLLKLYFAANQLDAVESLLESLIEEFRIERFG